MSRSRVLILALSFVLVPRLAWSADPPVAAAVVALDATSRTRGLDAEAARVLRPTQMTVLQGEELDVQIQRRREPEPDAAILARFAPATETIARGIERFFYMSPERALPEIEPYLDLAWHHPEVLAFRPDLADQIWQAGIVVMRAYSETGRADDARRQAERLLTLLPTRSTDDRIVPPDVRPVLAAARQSLATANASLRVSVPDPKRCKVYVNGAPADPQQTYVVDPQGKYFARSDCSEPATPPVWRVPVRARELRRVLVPPSEPQTYRLRDVRNEADRRFVEWYLEAVTDLAGTDVAVGVASPDEDTVVLVRYDRGSQAITWSDDDVAASIRRGMPRIFPEFAALLGGTEPSAPQAQRRVEEPRIDWWGVGLLGGGGVLTTVGAIVAIDAAKQGRLIDCAVNNPAPPAGRNCSRFDDDAIYFEDLEAERRAMRASRAGGYVLIGAGIASIGYGLFRVLRGRPQRTASAGARLFPVGMEVRW